MLCGGSKQKNKIKLKCKKQYSGIGDMSSKKKKK